MDTVDFPSNQKTFMQKNSTSSEGCFTFHNTDARETMNMDDIATAESKQIQNRIRVKAKLGTGQQQHEDSDEQTEGDEFKVQFQKWMEAVETYHSDSEDQNQSDQKENNYSKK